MTKLNVYWNCKKDNDVPFTVVDDNDDSYWGEFEENTERIHWSLVNDIIPESIEPELLKKLHEEKISHYN